MSAGKMLHTGIFEHIQTLKIRGNIDGGEKTLSNPFGIT